jgi:Ca2+-binding RTX toxin-like protein
MFETLENRRMLSVTAKFDDAASTYRVEGTEEKEHIEVVVDSVTASNTRRSSTFGAATMTYDRVRVFDAGVLVTSTLQPANSIKAVEVNASGGNDVVIASNDGRPARLFVDGGAGDDRVETTATSGAPGNTARGGAGDDLVTVTSGKGSADGNVAYGGGGGDTITGSDFDDQLFGDDAFRATADDDGADVIFGGAGNDVLFGGGGDDRLDGQAGNDKIDGGDGFDTAVADKEDAEPTAVEQLVIGGPTGSDTL